ncbi:MAG: hypothetical protein ACREXP_23395, partial [Steroidobacteraceae bacterium]
WLMERFTTLGNMYAQAAMPAEADEVARRWDRIATKVEPVELGARLRNELTKAYAAAYSGDSARVHRLTQAIRDLPECPETARLESLAIDLLDARWQAQSHSRDLALRLAEDVEASRQTPYRRGKYLSSAASALLAANDQENAQRLLALAADWFAKAGLTAASIHMTDFVNARTSLGLLTGDSTVHDDLQTLVSAWQKVNPDGTPYGEALYWLSRVQAAEGQAETASQTRQQAAQILKNSKLPALRLLAS